VDNDQNDQTHVTPRNESLRVLIVEDDRLARGALRSILEMDGHDVSMTGNGQRAIRLLKTFDPHVVIMDWQLPGLWGEPLCRSIQRRSPRAAVIVVSSSDEAFASGVPVNARLRKPLDVERLRSIVANCLSNRVQR
jgi:DNA-binding response OmpR family regulator